MLENLAGSAGGKIVSDGKSGFAYIHIVGHLITELAIAVETAQLVEVETLSGFDFFRSLKYLTGVSGPCIINQVLTTNGSELCYK